MRNRAAATTTLILERQEGRNQIFSTESSEKETRKDLCDVTDVRFDHVTERRQRSVLGSKSRAEGKGQHERRWMNEVEAADLPYQQERVQ